jgi:hypothetical protein
MTKGKPGAGLHGPDKQQAHLRDKRGGAYDAAGHQHRKGGSELRERVPHEDAPRTTGTADLPEGLTRKPKGPYDKDAGRRRKPAQG